MSEFGHFISLYARAIRKIPNYAQINEYRAMKIVPVPFFTCIGIMILQILDHCQ